MSERVIFSISETLADIDQAGQHPFVSETRSIQECLMVILREDGPVSGFYESLDKYITLSKRHEQSLLAYQGDGGERERVSIEAMRLLGEGEDEWWVQLWLGIVVYDVDE